MPNSTASVSENRVVIELNDTILELVEADITELDVDAIVNPANRDLKMKGGLSRQIRKLAGPTIQKECDRIGEAAAGTAVLTGAGKMPFKHVIHAVGPKQGDGDEDRKLASAVRTALALADRQGLASLALPAISTGEFGFPMDRCARIALTEIHRYLQGGTKLQQVVICLYDEQAYETFLRELKRGFR